MSRLLLTLFVLALCTGCPAEGSKTDAAKTGTSAVAEVAKQDAKALAGKSGKGLTPAAMEGSKKTFETITRGKRQGEAKIEGEVCVLTVTWAEPKSKGALLANAAQSSGDQFVRVAVTQIEGRPTSDTIGETQHEYRVSVVDGEGTVLAEGTKAKDAEDIAWKGGKVE